MLSFHRLRANPVSAIRFLWATPRAHFDVVRPTERPVGRYLPATLRPRQQLFSGLSGLRVTRTALAFRHQHSRSQLAECLGVRSAKRGGGGGGGGGGQPPLVETHGTDVVYTYAFSRFTEIKNECKNRRNVQKIEHNGSRTCAPVGWIFCYFAWMWGYFLYVRLPGFSIQRPPLPDFRAAFGSFDSAFSATMSLLCHWGSVCPCMMAWCNWAWWRSQ